MEEATRNKLIFVLSILTIIFFLTTVSSCVNMRRERTDRDKEMALRMDLEEKASKYSSENAQLEENIKELNQLIEQEKSAHKSTKEALSQEQTTTQKLREELNRLTKLKETLEEDLKDVLVSPAKK